MLRVSDHGYISVSFGYEMDIFIVSDHFKNFVFIPEDQNLPDILHILSTGWKFSQHIINRSFRKRKDSFKKPVLIS